MELDDLEDLFEVLNIETPTPDQLYELYGIFLRDLVKNPLMIKGCAIRYNNTPSKHPLCKGKAQTFEHIITRESKFSKKRNFDCFRGNKIHWIRPIIENADSPRVKYFERTNNKGQNQYFYWLQEKSFIIIIRNIQPGYLLITSFCVDNNKIGMYKSWHQEYIGQKKPHFVSEARTLRQCDWSERATCHVLYPLGTDITNVLTKT